MKIIIEVEGKKYKIAFGGCRKCAFNRSESEDDYCAYTEEVDGVRRFKCNLKLGEHYEEVRDDTNH